MSEITEDLKEKAIEKIDIVSQNLIEKLRSEFIKIGYENYFEDTLNRYYIEKPNCDFHHYAQKEFQKLHKEDKKLRLKKEFEEDTEQVKKASVIDYKSRQHNHSSEIITNYILKWFPIKSIRNDEKQEMYIYNNGIYEENAKCRIKEITRDMLLEDFNETFNKKIINKVEADTFINFKEMLEVDNPYDVPIQNGILNLITKEIKPFTPDRYFFNKVPVYYDPKATCPNFKKFLESIFPEETKEENIRLIFEIFGACLIREYKYRKGFMFQGKGGNGKSILLSVLINFLGINNISNLSLQQISDKDEEYKLHSLAHKLANIGGDIGSKPLMETQAYKTATGGDPIQAKRKFKSDITFINYATMIFSANELPRPHDNSVGFYDRWLFVDFPYEFIDSRDYAKYNKEEIEKNKFKIANPNIKEKINTKEELSGILNEALIGISNLNKNGGFSVNQSSKEIKELWEIRLDSFNSFCERYIEMGDEKSYIEVSELNKRYKEFCLKNRAECQNLEKIGNILYKKYFVDRHKQEKRTNINGKRVRVYPNIKFKNLEHQKNFNEVM